jgi:hypothetical protein
MRRFFIFVNLFIFSYLVFAIDVPKLPFAPRHYVCYRADVPLQIDGVLTEPTWQNIEWTDFFVDIEGSLRPAPRFKTRAKMMWDDAYFYVAAELQEPHVWANLLNHDDIIFYDNDFEVFIDPDGDTHRYYELELNAFATHWDLFLDKPYRDECKPLFFWDIRGIKKAVAIQGTINQPTDVDTGWTIELAIPWSVLKEQASDGRAPQAGEQWRVNFSRVEWRVHVEDGMYVKDLNPATGKPFPEDNWVWSPQGLINMHYPETWGFVQFSGILAGQGVESFKPQADDTIKWLLRQVYYSQRALQKKEGHFTNLWSDLGLKIDPPDGYHWPVKLSVTDHLFEASLVDRAGDYSWHIRQDGLIWKVDHRKLEK